MTFRRHHFTIMTICFQHEKFDYTNKFIKQLLHERALDMRW